jgi:hypothetical protein
MNVKKAVFTTDGTYDGSSVVVDGNQISFKSVLIDVNQDNLTFVIEEIKNNNVEYLPLKWSKG